MSRFIDAIKTIVTKNLFFTSLLLAGAFLRFYKLQEFTIFLSDQGRDALIVKDIVTLTHLPLIGAPTSIGQVFLGPAYYYLIAPFLPLFNFNPVGLSYGVAVYSLLGAIACYAVIKREINIAVALLFSVLVLFSSVQLELSRFSWNPNLLPISSFFALYFLYKLFNSPKVLYGALFGFFLGLSLQFHYLALLMGPAIAVFYGVFYVQNSGSLKKTLKATIVAPTIALFISISPLILFDLRHNFINSSNFLKLFTEQKDIPHELLSTRFLNVNNAFMNLFFHHQFSVSQALALSITLFAIYIVVSKRWRVPYFIHMNAIAVFLFVIFFAFLQTPRHIHYFTPIYLSFSLVLAYLLSLLTGMKKWGVIVLAILLFAYLRLNLYNLPFLVPAGNGQINHAQRVAQFIGSKVGNEPYNIATWPVYFTEDNYIYFLSLQGQAPADRKKLEITNQMIVLCGEEPCLVENSPSWNISMFGPAKIDTMWEIEGIKVYKLLHK
ncbi:MAG: glycosyltransferase family 39 protein [Microgenomates group bacterium]